MVLVYNWRWTPLCDKKWTPLHKAQYHNVVRYHHYSLDAIVNFYRSPAPAVLEQVKCTGKERRREDPQLPSRS